MPVQRSTPAGTTDKSPTQPEHKLYLAYRGDRIGLRIFQHKTLFRVHERASAYGTGAIDITLVLGRSLV